MIPLFGGALIALIISVILTPIVAALAVKFGFVDDPRVHKHPAILHSRIIPRAGGLPVFIAVAAAAFLVLPVSKELIGIFLGGLILVAVGLYDDRRDLRNSYKLILQLAAAIVVVASGVGINFITNPLTIISPGGLGLGSVIHLDALRFAFNLMGTHSIVILADLAAIFWIVWVINMVNFSTGVDGQMPGVVFITLIVIFAATLRFSRIDPSQVIVIQLALIGAGAILGFLIYNFFPAKIFPGDSGSYFMGFLVAVLAILAGVRVGTAMLVMAVPLVDGVFTVMRRIASHRSPFRGDRKHLHHRLLELGWGQRRIALFYWLLCAILGSIALLLHSFEKLFAAVVVAIIILGGLIWLNMTLQPRDRD